MSNIAYIGPSGIFGGVRLLVEHCNGLARRGHNVTYLVTDGQPISWLACNFNQRPISDPGAGYDVIVGSAIGTWPGTVEMARKLGAKSSGVMQMAEWLFYPKGADGYRANLEAFTAPLDSVMVISEWLAKMAEQVEGRPVKRIQTGVDPRLFFRQPFPDAPGFEGVTVVTEGHSANPAKDYDEMTLRALRHVKNDMGLPVRVIGFSQFQQASEIYDRYWTQPQQNVIRNIYSSADIFLKASRYEGRPGPDLEAMACGTAVCRAIGAGDDDLIDGHNCLKVNYGDQAGFVANLLKLIREPDYRAWLAGNASEYVKSRTWEASIDAVEETLTGAVTQQREDANDKAYQYDLAAYNDMQRVIVEWETPQAMWLGETLADMVQPESVIDVGCGPGIYLVPFKPAARVLGVDGAPEAGKALARGEFVTADFRQDWFPTSLISLGGDAATAHENGTALTVKYAPAVFDLALCIEVAEHLPPDRADYLVSLLCQTATKAVFFSAAQPGQGGTLHLNEQPREYWLEKFRARGFDLHHRHGELVRAIAANPHCQRVQWLIGNAMLLGRRDDGG